MLGLIIVVVLTADPAGCTKDTDCKGDRICESGRCVAPAPAVEVAPFPPLTKPPAPPPVAAPPTSTEKPEDYPRVVRRNGQTCVLTLDDRGKVHEACRAEGTDYTAPSTEKPEDYPREVRRNGQTCVQTLDDRGKVREACREEGMERGNSGRVVHQSDTPLVRERDRAPTKPEVTEPVERESRFVADYGVVAALGLISSGTRSGLLFGVGVHGGWGGRFTPGFGMEGLIDMHLLGGPGGVLINIAAAPGLRFGHRSHFVLGLGPSLAFVNTIAGLQTFIEGTLTLRGVILFGDGGFGLHLDGSVVFDQSGALFMFGIGLGGSSV